MSSENATAVSGDSAPNAELANTQTAETKSAEKSPTEIWKEVQAELENQETKDTKEPTEQKAKTDSEEAPEDEAPEEDEKPKKTSKEKRRSVVEREIEARRKATEAKRRIEEATNKLQYAEQLESQLQNVITTWSRADELVKSGKVVEALETLGLSPQEVASQLIALAKGKDPEVDSVKKELEEIKREKQEEARRQQESQREAQLSQAKLSYDKALAQDLWATNDPYLKWIAEDPKRVRAVAQIQEAEYDGTILDNKVAAKRFLSSVRKSLGVADFLKVSAVQEAPSAVKDESKRQSKTMTSQVQAAGHSNRKQTREEIIAEFAEQFRSLPG